jgi:hypothetical protein
MQSTMKYAAAAATLLVAGAFAAPSQAAIFIGLHESGVNGGAITTVANGSNFAVFNAAYGTFELELLTGVQAVAPTLLGSTTSDHNIRGSGGVLNIYITRTDIDGSVPYVFSSNFTSNVLPKKWSVTEASYVSTINQLYTGALLSSHTFTKIGTFTALKSFAGGQEGLYSVTTRYTLNAPTTGTSLSTVSIAAVPEPGAWALMIMGFGGTGAMLRSRRRPAAALL